MNWKEWYLSNSPGVLLLGILILAGTHIYTYISDTLFNTNIINTPNHPICLVALFGMCLIVVGAGSMCYVFVKYENPKLKGVWK